MRTEVLPEKAGSPTFSIVTITKNWQERPTRDSIFLNICPLFLKHAASQSQMQSRHILSGGFRVVHTGLFRIQRTVSLSQNALVPIWRVLTLTSWKSGPFVSWNIVWRGRQNLANRVEKVLDPPCADFRQSLSRNLELRLHGHWWLCKAWG